MIKKNIYKNSTTKQAKLSFLIYFKHINQIPIQTKLKNCHSYLDSTKMYLQNILKECI